MIAATRDALLALAEKVEAATGPSFLIEQEIADAVGHNPRARLPKYTASLDAAMTLVPERHAVDVTMWGPHWGGQHRARLLPLIQEGDRLFHRGSDPHYCVNAATPALALTAAALRARAAMMGEG